MGAAAARLALVAAVAMSGIFSRALPTKHNSMAVPGSESPPTQSEALSAAPPGPLKQLLLAPERIANVAASLLSGLAEMHEQGLGHFDVKPPK